ncbi:hypothetical protein HMPREF0183_2342 [Brevibacterium mcbrellneri ATCC 49030]|uniref:MT0933-like antitoxin protein n=1 Tax=Brevibacterium mcbrellneri ATCC 49030 TaxID=585530 RepID=D4YQY2_9MICO|nr:antitoxin [Brevibacterium mcbrellneri]EFG46373.1 hypothetical protein HMPREF0183_2342 [Brevibacterium mcbrellneri ATCC 49030]
MGLGDFADKAKDAVKSEQAEGVTDDVLDKGADFANDKTGGKFEDQVNQGRDAADGHLGNE